MRPMETLAIVQEIQKVRENFRVCRGNGICCHQHSVQEKTESFSDMSQEEIRQL